MAKKSITDPRATRTRSSKIDRPAIDEPLQVMTSARASKMKVPKLVLSGEWLKAIGFPIGAPLHLACDRRGEIVLHRLGLRLPRTLRILAKSQRPNAIRRTVR